MKELVDTKGAGDLPAARFLHGYTQAVTCSPAANLFPGGRIGDSPDRPPGRGSISPRG